MYRTATPPTRRRVLALAAALIGAAPASLAAATAAADLTGGDPFGSHQWPELRKEFLGGPESRVEFDPRVQVRGPAFAEDPMNVPISVSADGIANIEQIVVLVDRNPIRKVLEFRPRPATKAAISFRFKLEQASPVRAAVLTQDGVWHVGATLVESSGGGCTVPGATRKDGSWSRTLGEVSGRLFDGFDGRAPRLRVRVMHPMDTGLVGAHRAAEQTHQEDQPTGAEPAQRRHSGSRCEARVASSRVRLTARPLPGSRCCPRRSRERARWGVR